MNTVQKTNDIGAALTLMLMSPLLTEVLPGATRFSSIFVLPIEICVWGGGALMIRYAVRRWGLGWSSMLLMALALAIAEECIIQQTSLAPLVIRLKGETYARALGVNYVYFLWALIYEPTFVVFASIYLVELIFPGRRQRPWISRAGFFVVIPLFLLGGLLAWFSWTRIARPKVFKLDNYNPPPLALLLSFAVIIGLVWVALARRRQPAAIKPHPASHPVSSPALRAPAPALLFITGTLWASLLFGLVLLGFGIAPSFPPAAAIAGGFILLLTALTFIPKWTSTAGWQHPHLFALLFGVIFGSMAISFLGFIGTTGPDLYFKVVTNVIAVVLLAMLGFKINSKK